MRVALVLAALCVSAVGDAKNREPAKSPWDKWENPFAQLNKAGASVPAWFLDPKVPDDGKDTTRPKTPLDKTASLQANLVFDAGANQAKSCEVLMTNGPEEAGASLCETVRKTLKISPEAVQAEPSQRHFWIHVYTDGDVSQMTMTEPVLSTVKL